jgi:protein-S-isoprenylcysteine O-methyltransferase Ste14
MVHPRAHRWRARVKSPFRVLVPAWIVMWVGVGALTGPWRSAAFYSTPWSWIPALLLFATGISIYSRSGAHFSWAQLGGLPEVRVENQHQRLVTTGIRSRVRHPVYLGHLCEMLAWSIGTGLIVCWVLTVFAVVTGAVMIRMEDDELEKRFGAEYREYRRRVPSLLGWIKETHEA